jgi:thiamine-phosphate pyrophosphorylase
MEVRGLYAIADNQFNRFPTIPEYVEQLLAGGARIIQLRMKSSQHLAFGVAKEIMSFKKRWPFTFIVNDFIDVAIEVGADGVHVGKNDASIKEVKERLPEQMIVGYSSHSLEEAVEAQSAGADYVAFGAIYPTPTKGPEHPVQGTPALKKVVESLDVPVVAIGGIGRHNLDEVLNTGVQSVAMITALSQAQYVSDETRWFVKAVKSRGRF